MPAMELLGSNHLRKILQLCRRQPQPKDSKAWKRTWVFWTGSAHTQPRKEGENRRLDKWLARQWLFLMLYRSSQVIWARVKNKWIKRKEAFSIRWIMGRAKTRNQIQHTKYHYASSSRRWIRRDWIRASTKLKVSHRHSRASAPSRIVQLTCELSSSTCASSIHRRMHLSRTFQLRTKK